MELEEENTYTRSIDDYLQIFQRRKYTILVSTLLLFFISIVVTLVLPLKYHSTATILIEQQKIPDDFVRSTVMSSADERIMQIQQSVMTVDNINKIIEKYQLYHTKNKDILDLADKFREDFTYELLSGDVITRAGRGKVALAFKLGFFHQSPFLAQKTTSEITNLFLNENIKSRTEGAIQTTKFLDEEAKQLKETIKETEIGIAQFKQKNSRSLPERLAASLAEIGEKRMQLELSKGREQILAEQKMNLEAQLAATSPFPVDLTQTDGKSLVPETLPKLKADYAALLGKYSPLHPDVVALKHKIDNYQDPDSSDNAEKATNPVYLNLEGQIRAIALEQKLLVEQRAKLIPEINDMQMQISRTPHVEQELSDLMRDLESNKTKYKEIVAKYLEAKLSQSLEQEQKSEKFSVLEAASLPNKPEKPNRPVILLIGFAASIAAGIAIGFGIDLSQNKVYGYNQASFFAEMPLLIVIPYISNAADIVAARKIKIRFIIFCICLLVSTLIVIHYLYLPINEIMDRVLNQMNNI